MAPQQIQWGTITLHRDNEAFRKGFLAAGAWYFADITKLHKGMYAELRVRYQLLSQLACSVERQVSATYKGLWTKCKKNVAHRRAKITKKRFKGLDQPPHYSSPTVQYTRRAGLHLSV
jgi:hypothetical protein